MDAKSKKIIYLLIFYIYFIIISYNLIVKMIFVSLKRYLYLF